VEGEALWKLELAIAADLFRVRQPGFLPVRHGNQIRRE